MRCYECLHCERSAGNFLCVINNKWLTEEQIIFESCNKFKPDIDIEIELENLC